MEGVSRRAFNRKLVSALLSTAIPTAWVSAIGETRIALLLSGVITDGGWSQLAYDGLKQLKARGGIQTAYAENISLAQMDQGARGYSHDRLDLIIVHSDEFSRTLLEVAPDHPSQHIY